MGIPNLVHQAASNGVAILGNWISLHTAAAGTTGASEATGGSYARQQSSAWTQSGAGVNTGTTVNIPCAAGTYVEGGINSQQSGSTLAAPANLSATGASSGGSIPAGTYYFVVTALNFAGETTKSNEPTGVVLTGSTSAVNLAWNAVADATGYNVYVGTAAGGEDVLIASIYASATVVGGSIGSIAAPATTFTATTITGVAQSPPGSNSATCFVASQAFTGGNVTVTGTGASVNVTPSISA